MTSVIPKTGKPQVQLIEKNIKWIMLISGLITCTMVFDGTVAMIFILYLLGPKNRGVSV